MRRAPSLVRAGNRAGRREIERETKVGHEIEVQCWLNRPTKTKKRGKQRIERGRTHLAGRRQPRSLAYLPVREEPRCPAHLCRCARTRAALGISAARGPASSSPLRGTASVGPRPHAAPPSCTSSASPRPHATPARLQWPGNSFPLLWSAGLLLSALRSSLPLLCCSACACSVALLVLALLYAWLCQPFKNQLIC